LSLKSFLPTLHIAALLFFGSPLQAEEINIYFKTAPMVELLRPNSDAANLSLLITGADGRPVERGMVTIRLDAPKPGRVFSTDVPMIEGTILHQMRLRLRQGRVNWKYQFPIRGEYRLAVDFDDGAGNQAKKNFQFTIRENRRKWLALGGFSLLLFIAGFGAGRIFSGPRVKAMAFVMAMIFLGLGRKGELGAQTPPREAAAPQLEIEPATVGKPTRLHWRYNDGNPKTTVALSLSITQLEENQVVFAIERLPVAGKFSMDFHFTDGSEHRVSAVAEVQGRAPIKTEQLVNVTAVEPPMRKTIPALSCFLAVIALGLSVGRWSKRS
jgi:hypothetical protein